MGFFDALAKGGNAVAGKIDVAYKAGKAAATGAVKSVMESENVVRQRLRKELIAKWWEILKNSGDKRAIAYYTSKGKGRRDGEEQSRLYMEENIDAEVKKVMDAQKKANEDKTAAAKAATTASGAAATSGDAQKVAQTVQQEVAKADEEAADAEPDEGTEEEPNEGEEEEPSEGDEEEPDEGTEGEPDEGEEEKKGGGHDGAMKLLGGVMDTFNDDSRDEEGEAAQAMAKQQEKMAFDNDTLAVEASKTGIQNLRGNTSKDAMNESKLATDQKNIEQQNANNQGSTSQERTIGGTGDMAARKAAALKADEVNANAKTAEVVTQTNEQQTIKAGQEADQVKDDVAEHNAKAEEVTTPPTPGETPPAPPPTPEPTPEPEAEEEPNEGEVAETPPPEDTGGGGTEPPAEEAAAVEEPAPEPQNPNPDLNKNFNLVSTEAEVQAALKNAGAEDIFTKLEGPGKAPLNSDDVKRLNAALQKDGATWKKEQKNGLVVDPGKFPGVTGRWFIGFGVQRNADTQGNTPSDKRIKNIKGVVSDENVKTVKTSAPSAPSTIAENQRKMADIQRKLAASAATQGIDALHSNVSRDAMLAASLAANKAAAAAGQNAGASAASIAQARMAAQQATPDMVAARQTALGADELVEQARVAAATNDMNALSTERAELEAAKVKEDAASHGQVKPVKSLKDILAYYRKNNLRKRNTDALNIYNRRFY
jgi:hypothetical protein